MYPRGCRTYDQDDSTATEEVSLKALIDNPASRVHVEGSEHLRTMSVSYALSTWLEGRDRRRLTSSSSKISAEEYTARASVMRAFCPPLPRSLLALVFHCRTY